MKNLFTLLLLLYAIPWGYGADMASLTGDAFDIRQDIMKACPAMLAQPAHDAYVLTAPCHALGSETVSLAVHYHGSGYAYGTSCATFSVKVTDTHKPRDGL